MWKKLQKVVELYRKFDMSLALSRGNTSAPILEPLVTLINRVVRIISFAPYGNLNMSPIFKHLNFLNVNQIFHFETAKSIFKDVNELLPILDFVNYFFREPLSSRSTRSSCLNVVH